MDSEQYPPGERTLDVDAYLARSGIDGASRSDEAATATYLPVRCPVCFGELASTLEPGDAARHFFHRWTGDDARCALTTLSYQPEGMSVRHLRDVETALRHRKAFFVSWQRHYAVMRQLAPALSLGRFTRLIERADVLNLWSYRTLNQTDVPYVLLVLAEFMIQHGQVPLTWVRFCFDGRVRDVGDLWSPQASRPQLFRMIYRQPTLTPFPTARQLLHCEAVARGDTVLDIPIPRLGYAETREFERFLRDSANGSGWEAGSDGMASPGI